MGVWRLISGVFLGVWFFLGGEWEEWGRGKVQASTGTAIEIEKREGMIYTIWDIKKKNRKTKGYGVFGRGNGSFLYFFFFLQRTGVDWIKFWALCKQ